MERRTLIVVVPVGPTCQVDHVRDTLASVRHYVTASHAILLLDDSGADAGVAIQDGHTDVVVLPSTRPYGKGAGLYLNLSRAYRHALENYDFDVLLRLDTDALVIGPAPEADAGTFFNDHPGVGLIGSYRTDTNGDPRDTTWPRNELKKELGLPALLANPIRRWSGWRFLRQCFAQAAREGYEPGEHCLGGACFLSRECVQKLHDSGFLGRRELLWTKLQEDHLFGLLIHAAGLRHGDFATGSLPMGLRWQGLPCSPEELLETGKKVTHSTRFYEDLDEEAIRAFFRARREG